MSRPRFQDQRGVGGDAIHHAQVVQFADGIHIGGIDEEFHGDGPLRGGAGARGGITANGRGRKVHRERAGRQWWSGSIEAGETVGVLTTEPLGRVLDYRAPEGGCGDRRFRRGAAGPRRVLGVVWGPGEGDWDPAKLRPSPRAGGAPRCGPSCGLSGPRRRLHADALAGDAAAGHPRAGAGEPPATRRVYRLAGAVPNQLTEARHRVVEALRAFGGAAVTLGELAEAAACGTSVVKGLVKLGGGVRRGRARAICPIRGWTRPKAARLEGDQVAAGDALVPDGAGGYSATLLKGVTGSGKTEVYLEAVAECLRRGGRRWCCCRKSR
jgi:primosomal protein N' (replication factor Y)